MWDIATNLKQSCENSIGVAQRKEKNQVEFINPTVNFCFDVLEAIYYSV